MGPDVPRLIVVGIAIAAVGLASALLAPVLPGPDASGNPGVLDTVLGLLLVLAALAFAGSQAALLMGLRGNPLIPRPGWLDVVWLASPILLVVLAVIWIGATQLGGAIPPDTIAGLAG